jgi:hydrogen peroxide-dependent heme synthase
MTTIGMHYDVLPGKQQQFEQGFMQVLELLKKMPGHVESNLYQNVQAAGSYVIFSQWRSLEDFQTFIRSDAFAKTVAWGKAEILSGKPRHKIYADQ